METQIPVGFAGAVIAVNILMQAFKRFFEPYEVKRVYPLLAEVLGLVIGVLTGLTWFESLFIGAAAMGTYDIVNRTVLGK